MASETSGERTPGPRIEDFLDDPTREIESWAWLWSQDRAFPSRGRKGPLGRLVLFGKRLLRPLVKASTSDLWDRQRVFNLIVLEHLANAEAKEENLAAGTEGLAEHTGVLETRTSDLKMRMSDLATRTTDLETRTSDLEGRTGDLASRADDLASGMAGLESTTVGLEKRTSYLEGHMETFLKEGVAEIMRYNDALYSRVDQKLDRYSRQSRDVSQQMAAALTASMEMDARPIAATVEESDYRELEARYRGTPEEISERAAEYLPLLEGRNAVLDLGCGRGEVLALLSERGIGCRGVDASLDMVRLCSDRGLEAQQGDLLRYLAGLDEGSLEGIVSFHVIEHLEATSINRLVRLAWRVLAAGGILILETPNPLSIVVAASSFWRDPTHRRPIHPDALFLSFELAGFERIERRYVRPFPSADRLPEIDLERLDEPSRELAQQTNQLRDRLDETLFGYQDYAIIGYRP